MRDYFLMDPRDTYRRTGTARRALTLAPLAPSQDVTRYQAQLMPPPVFDLDRKEEPATELEILIRTLAFVATGGAIVLIQHIGVWLGP